MMLDFCFTIVTFDLEVSRQRNIKAGRPIYIGTTMSIWPHAICRLWQILCMVVVYATFGYSDVLSASLPP
jgi:hypothetical protein